jgi:hypothetical protein
MRTTTRLATLASTAALLVLSGIAAAQPPAMNARGCCCAVQAKTYTCTEKTQADCLAEQPQAPTYPKMDDWKKAWNDAVKTSEAQAAKPMRGGWIAGPCEK